MAAGALIVANLRKHAHLRGLMGDTVVVFPRFSIVGTRSFKRLTTVVCCISLDIEVLLINSSTNPFFLFPRDLIIAGNSVTSFINYFKKAHFFKYKTEKMEKNLFPLPGFELEAYWVGVECLTHLATATLRFTLSFLMYFTNDCSQFPRDFISI